MTQEPVSTSTAAETAPAETAPAEITPAETATINTWLQRLNNWKMPIIVGGGFLGAAIGLVAARLYIHADEVALDKDRRRGPQGLSLSPGLILPLLVTLVGLIREIGSIAGQDSTEQKP